MLHCNMKKPIAIHWFKYSTAGYWKSKRRMRASIPMWREPTKWSTRRPT